MKVRDILNIQKQLLPDLMDVMKKRYTILHHILISGSVGRRALASTLHLTERILRSEVEFLKAQGLIEVSVSGMSISDAGRELVERMTPLIQEAFGLTHLEERIRYQFGLQRVVVVPGDADVSPTTKKELGRAGAEVLRRTIVNGDIVAVNGGSTMADVAEHLTSTTPLNNSWFIPARGGLGESMELQSNTIAAQMAKRTGAHYRLFHVPDDLGEEAYQSLLQEPNIREIIDIIRNCRLIIHGIGEASVMAQRRKVEPQMTADLMQHGAIAEALGYYFDQDGNIVRKPPMLGLRLEDIERAECVIGVAGGRSKGAAIAAVLRFGQEDILVTDEAAAEEILQCL